MEVGSRMHTTKDAPKTRKVRKTYRQRVLEIYPNAEWRGCEISCYIATGNWYESRRKILCGWNEDQYNSRDAWKKAWKNIQYEMIQKLEN